MKSKFDYVWALKDANFTKDKGSVFSCFACGGGSTMGYKLAGFDVIGCNEIDNRMIEMYKKNHNPKFTFHESITTFKLRNDLPDELYNLDILDGSPPCSSFSLAGNRDKDWGKEKVFREGQELQVLDTLFFDFIDLAKKLQPKVVIAENVKGLLLGNAKLYVDRIYKEFDESGYYCQHFLLNAMDMGVPQSRERVFFICLRKDLAKQFLDVKNLFEVEPKINIRFNYDKLPIKTFATFIKKRDSQHYSDRRFGDVIVNLDKPSCTITSGIRLWKDSEFLLDNMTVTKISSFPTDYDFIKNVPVYVCGMSVPPIMTANLVTEVYNQWLSKL